MKKMNFNWNPKYNLLFDFGTVFQNIMLYY